jgi:hypothetical protein
MQNKKQQRMLQDPVTRRNFLTALSGLDAPSTTASQLAILSAKSDKSRVLETSNASIVRCSQSSPKRRSKARPGSRTCSSAKMPPRFAI